jgi:hypothetical protein
MARILKKEVMLPHTVLQDKACGIKLKVLQSKHKNIKLIRTVIKIMGYDVKIVHVMFRVLQCCVNNCGKPNC